MFKRIQNVDCFRKTVLVRADLNVPMKNGIITDNTRLLSIKSTLDFLKGQQAKIVLISHFGRPEACSDPLFWDKKYTLSPLVQALNTLYDIPFSFAPKCVGEEVQKAIQSMDYGSALLLENLRYYPGEEKNDEAFSKELALGMDVYVNDAFSCSHRSHASIDQITRYIESCAGFSLQAELDALQTLLEAPTRPLLAVVGGSKVSTKLDLLTNLCRKVDHIFIGGAMAHTFWVAMGYGIGKSVHEPNYVTTASEILKHYGTKIHLPQDCMVAESLENPEKIYSVSPHAIPAHMSVFDVGPHTVEVMGSFLQQVKTVVWNGPVGAFEFPPFHEGSMSLARVVGALTEKKILQSIAGGGDTLAALEMAGVKDQFTYLSTAGGAFLEWLEGKKLPGVAALQV